MTASEFRAVADFEAGLKVDQPVLVRWTAGSFGHFAATATVFRVNRSSVRVTLTEEISEDGRVQYPVGRQIVVPLFTARTWAHFNRVEPAGGYLEVK